MAEKITIAVASGKGGTGKTTIATNLAASAGVPLCLLDCDVEEPNAHIFIAPESLKSETARVMVPQVDPDACDGCGECQKVCRFNAIAVTGKPMFFNELCHGCGACVYACPREAIHEAQVPVGVVESGTRGEICFAHGRLNIGEIKSPPLIKIVREKAEEHDTVLIDSPPGAACPVVAAVNNADYCVLVAEPTPFGMHDLKIAFELVEAIGIPTGLVINRSDTGDDRARRFAEEHGIPVLAEIPYDRGLAETYSTGGLISEASEKYRDIFAALWKRILKEARQ